MVESTTAGVLKLVVVEGEISIEQTAQLDLFVSVETPH